MCGQLLFFLLFCTLVYISCYYSQGNSLGFLRVEVIDTGAGIADEDQVKVFGEFAQFNRNELQGGGEMVANT